MTLEIAAQHIEPPFATAVHVFVTVFLAASYIPQIIAIIAANGSTDTAISGWYMTLLTTSATAQFALRIRNLKSSGAWSSVRHNELKGFNAFSVLVVYLQAFIHWAAAMTLLAVYVLFRGRSSTRKNDNESSTNSTSTTPSPSPSTMSILAVVFTHAVIVLPTAIYLLNILTEKLDELADPVILLLSVLYGALLRLTGTLAALLAAVPQIRLIVARYRSNGNTFDRGDLSLLGLGLQAIAFLALAGSQGWRMRLRPAWDPDYTFWQWCFAFFIALGLALGWVVLAFSQFLVLCVSLGLWGREREGAVSLKRE